MPSEPFLDDAAAEIFEAAEERASTEQAAGSGTSRATLPGRIESPKREAISPKSKAPTVFKVIAIAHPGLSAPPGFEPVDDD